MSFTGLVQIGIEIGLDAILVKPKRQIGSFTADVTLEEHHTDELRVTDQPVEQGAMISDHAFKLPAQLTVKVGWSNSTSTAPDILGGILPGGLASSGSSLIGSLASAVTGTIGGITSLLTGNSQSQVKEVYSKFLALQASAIPFDVYTGKRVYKNMLITGMDTITTKETENSLILVVRMREVNLVATATTGPVGPPAPPEDQEDPEDTDPTEDEGDEQLNTDASDYNEDAGDATLEADPPDVPATPDPLGS